MNLRPLIILGLMLASLGVLRAQDGAMERIVAIVGKEIILKSDVDGQIELLAQRNPSIKKTDPALRRQILDLLINERLIVTKAIEDSVDVTDEEVSQRMEMQIQTLVQQFGSEQRIEQLYGMSMARIRREFRDEIRKQLLAAKLRETKFNETKASRTDVEAFYARYKDSLPKVPARIDLFHIVRYIKPSDAQKKETYQLALRVRDSIMKGAAFADMARRYSGDPMSAAAGGDLGSIEKGKLVPTFEATAFSLQTNEISQPVETPFGYHVIQLIDKTSSSVNCRHILFKIGQSDDDKQRTQDLLLDLKRRVAEGSDFETLAREFSEEKETQGFGGAMGQLELTRLPEEMRSIVTSLPDGGVSDPLPYAADPTKPGYHIIWRKGIAQEHVPTLESDYKMIEQMAVFDKRQRLEQDWLQQLRKTMYWEYRD
jgi:peptidyl-prolyl cis-trans isomerase SurA